MPTFRKKEGEKINIFFHEEDDKKKKNAKLVVEINKKDKLIKLFPKPGSFFLPEIEMSDFEDLPYYIAGESGYLKGGLIYYLDSRFSSRGVFRLEIAERKKSSFRKVPNKGYNVILNYDFVEEIVQKFNNISNEAKSNRAEIFDFALSKKFPRHFPKSDVLRRSGRNQVRRIVKSLEESSIDFFKNIEAQKVVDFFIKLVTKRSRIQKFFNLAKVKVDEITLDSVVNKLQDLIDKNATEKEMSEFFIENLFVIDSKYMVAIPEINVVLGGTRKADFGLIDSDEYLDIFEIKRPKTLLLSSKDDHGNFYWHEQSVKAITQIEKYLYEAESKRDTFIRDLKRERRTDLPEPLNKSLKMVRPRGVLIIGDRKQLDNEAKKEDFRVLRSSLKNIEIILYDELLQRLKNQQNKIFIKTPDKKDKKVKISSKKKQR